MYVRPYERLTVFPYASAQVYRWIYLKIGIG